MVRGRPGLSGALLVGGASSRFGSPKALAVFQGRTLAERAHGLLAATCNEVLVVGKVADALPLPFDVLDDGSATRAPLAGLVAALRAARHDVCLVVPTDMPWLDEHALRALAAAAEGADAAVPQSGPLPGAYRRSALPVLERRLGAGELVLRDALGELETRVVELDEAVLANVNRPEDLPR